MAVRQPRTATCPGCGIQVTKQKCRPNSKSNMYCDTCKAHPSARRYLTLKFRYDLTFAEFDKLHEINNCECCGTELNTARGRNRRQIDHCHDTNQIRGVLCWNCNTSIGKLGDNVEGLERALNYLRSRS